VPRFLQLLAATQTTPSRRLGFALVITAIYSSVTLYPYGWGQPIALNHAAWSSSGSLAFDAPGIARTVAPPGWLESVRSTHRLKISLRIKPHGASQVGPARILTVSRDPYYRNITVAQDRGDLVLRLRTRESDLNGIPERRVRNALSAGVWCDVVIDVRPEQLAIRIDGKEKLAVRLAADPLARFDDSYLLAIGNELTGDRAWLGEIARATVSTPEGAVDYLASKQLILPGLLRWFHNEPILIPFRQYNPPDRLFNFLGFVPLGVIIGGLVVARGRTRRNVVRALLPAFFLSLLIEICQWAMPEHYPSVDDLILNTLCASAGVAVMLALHRRVT
jgi:hypothetical protein